MSSYAFRAARPDGVIITGAVGAESNSDAVATLAARGLYAIDVAPTPDANRCTASRRDLAVVFRGIAALVAGGVPLERALAAAVPLARGSLREALAAARERLQEGASFASAVAGSNGVVPRLVVGMIRAGERGSQLGAALEQVATHLEQEADLIARIRQALVYPLLLAVTGLVSVLVIGTVVVPRFAAVLSEFGQELPLATRLLLGISALLSRLWVPLVIAAVIATWCAMQWARTSAGRARWDAALLKLPLVGPVRRSLATARITRALGATLGAGMPLLPALDAARDAAGDFAIDARVRRASERVMQGAPLAAALEREETLSASALQLITVGESSGCVGEMALRAGDLAAQEADRALRTLVGALEPALVIGFGGLVAFTAAALLQAVYSLRPGG